MFGDPVGEQGGDPGRGAADAGQGAVIVDNDRRGAGRVRRGPSLVGEEHVHRRPKWPSYGCEAARAGPRCPLSRRSWPEHPPADRRREPFLVTPGFTLSATFCTPPLTVGEPTSRTVRLNRADVVNSKSWLPARRRHLRDPNLIQTQLGEHQKTWRCRRPVPVPKSCATPRTRAAVPPRQRSAATAESDLARPSERPASGAVASQPP
jgi:hypothetical protein